MPCPLPMPWCVVVLHTVRRAWDTVATVTVTDAEGDAEGAWPQDYY